MISNAKIRINLKEAKKNTEKSLTNPRKDWEIRIFKGFSINKAHGQSQLSQGKVQGTSYKYTPYILIFTGAKVIFFMNSPRHSVFLWQFNLYSCAILFGILALFGRCIL